MREAEELALERNEVLVSSGWLKKRGYQQYLQARSQWYPAVTVSGQAMKTQYANAAGDRYVNSGQVSVSQTLFSSDAYYGVQQGAYASDFATLEHASLANDIVFEVRRVYYFIVLLREQLAVNEEALGLLREALKTEKHRHSLGESTKFDVNQASVAVSNRLPAYYETRRKLSAERNRLRRLLHSDDADAGAIDIPIDRIPSVVDRLKDEIDTNVAQLFSDEEERQWERLALANSPAIRMQQLAVDTAQSVLRQKRGRYLPSVTGFANYSHSSTAIAYGHSRYWDAGVSMSWSLFDGLGRERGIREADASYKSAAVLLNNAREDTRIEVHDIFSAIESEFLSFYAADRSVTLAHEAMEHAKDRADIGEITPLEYREATNALHEARYNRNAASYNLLMAYYSLFHAAHVDIDIDWEEMA